MKNRKYTPNKKNGGDIPPVKDLRTLHVPVGCGKCIECKKQQARQWQVRLTEDIKHHKDGQFVTLTMSNESYTELAMKYGYLDTLTDYDLDNRIITTAVRLFLERWRKKYKLSLRHWLVSELGHQGTENIHLHGIIWQEAVLFDRKETIKEIQNTWQYGYTFPNERTISKTYLNEQTINYIVKYINKVDADHKLYNPLVLTSPGIGDTYTTSTNATKNKYVKKKHKKHTAQDKAPN